MAPAPPIARSPSAAAVAPICTSVGPACFSVAAAAAAAATEGEGGAPPMTRLMASKETSPTNASLHSTWAARRHGEYGVTR